MGKELWKVIPEFNDYEISNQGRLRCKSRYLKRGKGTMHCDSHFLKPVDNGRGYLKVTLKQNGRAKRFYVHRLVAMAFIPNPINKPFINHKDNNPKNNNVNNLEWCTPQENVDWMIIQGRNKRNPEWLKNCKNGSSKYFKPVKGTNLKTGEVIYFDCLNDVKNEGFQPACVCNCCKQKRKTHKGYIWEYAS